MVGILSIDFDYFIDASSGERDRYFPPGNDGIPVDKLELMWKERYLRYPELREIGLIKDYVIVKNYLRLLNIKRDNFYKSDSHKEIRKLIDRIPWNEDLRIVNIDFHHDYYHYFTAGEYYNCGNWLRRVVEERPNVSIKWIRREDPQTLSLEGEFPFEHTSDIQAIYEESFDYLFICRSPEWSPPHLSNKYEELAAVFTTKTA